MPYVKQLSIEFPRDHLYHDDDYIISECNNALYQKVINTTPLGVLPYQNNLIIIGSKSSGKTAISNLYASKHSALFIKSISDIYQMDKYLGAIIDNIDLWSNEEELLHIINLMHENKKSLLITSNMDINNLCTKYILKDLISRIKSFDYTSVSPPDTELIQNLITKRLSLYSIRINSIVINYMSRRLNRNFSEIFEFIETLNLASKERKVPISISLVKSLLYQEKSY